MRLAIDEGSDHTVKGVVIANVAVEAFVSVAMLVAFLAQSHMGAELIENFKRDFLRWRTKFFGAPPLSEEEIERHAKWVVVEAMKVVREAEA